MSDVDLAAAAQAALQASAAADLVSIGGELERRGQFALAWECLGQGARLRKPGPLPAWGGPGSPGTTLLVRRKMRHLGAELRNARFIQNALDAVDTVIVATEGRLVPLLARSFPAARVVDAADSAAWADADCEASYEDLALWFGRTDADVRGSFKALTPPPAQDQDESHGIGISWFSMNARKHLPRIEDWAEALAAFDQPIQSLQYDEENAGLARLGELAGKRIMPSMPIDQMQDVDAFSRQVASVCGVLTISNTTAHMAGALGVPCVVLLDDVQHLTWPSVGTQSPFYPGMRLVRHNGRPWRDVIVEGLTQLRSLVGN